MYQSQYFAKRVCVAYRLTTRADNVVAGLDSSLRGRTFRVNKANEDAIFRAPHGQDSQKRMFVRLKSIGQCDVKLVVLAVAQRYQLYGVAGISWP